MAVNFGTDNQGGAARRFSIATPPAHAAGQDWCYGFWCRFADLAGSNFEYVISRGTLGGNGSIHIFFGQESSSNPSQLIMRAKGTGGTENNFGGATVADNGTDYLCVVQRRGANIETYVVAKGASVSAPSTSNTDASTGDIATGTTLFGGRADLNNLRFLRNIAGELFCLVNDSLTAAEVEDLAVGANITAVRADPEINLRFLTYSTTEDDLSDNNHDATVTGTGIVTATHFFSDTTEAALAAAGSAAAEFTVVVNAIVSMSAAGSADTSNASTSAASAALSAAGSAADTEAALADAITALLAAVSAGESWAANAAAAVQLSAAGSADASFSSADIQDAAFTASTSSAAAFTSAVSAAVQFSAAGSSIEVITAVVDAICSVTASAVADGIFSAEVTDENLASLIEAASAAASLSALSNAIVALQASSAADATFDDIGNAVVQFSAAANATAAFVALTGGTQILVISAVSLVAAMNVAVRLQAGLELEADLNPALSIGVTS